MLVSIHVVVMEEWRLSNVGRKKKRNKHNNRQGKGGCIDLYQISNASTMDNLDSSHLDERRTEKCPLFSLVLSISPLVHGCR